MIERVASAGVDVATSAEARAHALEQTYHGCAQCVLAALMEAFGLHEAGAFRAASALGGGIGLTTEGSCGALTGGVMAIGLLYGRELDRLDDPERRRMTAYRLAQRLHRRFVDEYGGTACCAIHQKVFGRTYRLTDPDDWKAFLADGGHTRHCPAVVAKAARWAVEVLLEEGARRTP
jgi:C_GCAxxG_C_C family probable redox protein